MFSKAKAIALNEALKKPDTLRLLPEPIPTPDRLQLATAAAVLHIREDVLGAVLEEYSERMRDAVALWE